MSDQQEILSRIQKARCDLYVYKDSNAKEKWRDLLDNAYEALIEGNDKQAVALVSRCEEATSNLWSRISRWTKIQTRLTVLFGSVLVLLIALILTFNDALFSKFDLHLVAVIFGFLGGTISTLFSLGDNLSIEGSNRLGLIKSLIRPIVGCFNALIAAMLLETGIISIPSVGLSSEVMAIVGVAAGLTERFVTKRLSSIVG
ncbi:MAG: hypothetical protein AAF674_08170 [Pseudomonadota bacterium]